MEQYGVFLENSPESLKNIAYTLANKREHLPHRLYAVATSGRLNVAQPLANTAKVG